MTNLLSKLGYQHIGTDQSLWAYRCQHIAELQEIVTFTTSCSRIILFAVLAGNADYLLNKVSHTRTISYKSDCWIINLSSLNWFQVIFFYNKWIHCCQDLPTKKTLLILCRASAASIVQFNIFKQRIDSKDAPKITRFIK